MAFVYAVALVLTAYAGIVFIGDLECVEGTWVDHLSCFLTYGLASVAERGLAALFGPDRTAQAMTRCSGACDSGPIGQVVFSVIYAGCVIGVCLEILPKVPPTEQLLAAAYMGSVLLLFVVTCTSDPGIVTPSNQTQMLHLFPADGILRKEQLCETCMLMRPSQAKHHHGQCIAYFDHYCVWMRNSIGLFNMRYFLLFLIVTACACAHGALVGARLVYRDIYVVKGWRPTDRKVVYRILANRYQAPSALISFLVVCFVTLFAFFITHLVQILRGTTSYEYIKLRRMDEETRRRHSATKMNLATLKILLRPKHYLEAQQRNWKDE